MAQTDRLGRHRSIERRAKTGTISCFVHFGSMISVASFDTLAARVSEMRARLQALVPAMQHRAVELDAAVAFPEVDLAALTSIGLLSAPVPVAFGGLGLGTDPAMAEDTMEVLRLLGLGNLSVGRVFEAHVNAVRLICRYGTDLQIQEMTRDASNGELFALWVTDAPDRGLEIDPNGRLDGTKAPCSASGFATRALVTATVPSGGITMAVVPIGPDVIVDRSRCGTHGMRAAISGQIAFNGVEARGYSLLGRPGDYLRQPIFSAGAWRTSAVTLGGMDALLTEFRNALIARNRHKDPYQMERVGLALVAVETARLWVKRAALTGEDTERSDGDVVNIVNLARIAVEQACLGLIQIVQRGLGMSAFRTGTLTELLFRDLAMYLRQPAPDETLTGAAAHFMDRSMANVP